MRAQTKCDVTGPQRLLVFQREKVPYTSQIELEQRYPPLFTVFQHVLVGLMSYHHLEDRHRLLISIPQHQIRPAAFQLDFHLNLSGELQQIPSVSIRAIRTVPSQRELLPFSQMADNSVVQQPLAEVMENCLGRAGSPAVVGKVVTHHFPLPRHNRLFAHRANAAAFQPPGHRGDVD
jgi:hypothetical protein